MYLHWYSFKSNNERVIIWLTQTAEIQTLFCQGVGGRLDILIFLEGVCLQIQSYRPVQDFLLPAHENVFLPGKSQIFLVPKLRLGNKRTKLQLHIQGSQAGAWEPGEPGEFIIKPFSSFLFPFSLNWVAGKARLSLSCRQYPVHLPW